MPIQEQVQNKTVQGQQSLVPGILKALTTVLAPFLPGAKTVGNLIPTSNPTTTSNQAQIGKSVGKTVGNLIPTSNQSSQPPSGGGGSTPTNPQGADAPVTPIKAADTANQQGSGGGGAGGQQYYLGGDGAGGSGSGGGGSLTNSPTQPSNPAPINPAGSLTPEEQILANLTPVQHKALDDLHNQNPNLASTLAVTDPHYLAAFGSMMQAYGLRQMQNQGMPFGGGDTSQTQGLG